VALVGGLVLFGWFTGTAWLTSVVPGFRVMVPNTAVAFALSGLALVVHGRSGDARTAVLTLALVVFGLGAATLVEYIFNVRLGVERWLVSVGSVDVANTFAGRMSPQTAVNFCAIAVALAVDVRGTRSARIVGDAFAMVVLLSSWLALVGYAYDLARLYDAPRYPGLALHTAVAFLVLAFGSLFTNAGGLASRLMSDGPDGAMRRRLVPAAVFVPLILGWVRLAGERGAWLDGRFGVALLAITYTIVIGGLIWMNAESVLAIDNRRREAERALRTAHDGLEQRVRQRTRELEAANTALRAEVVHRERIERERLDLLDREQAARQRAEQADRLKDEFLATVSHELRTPLNAILGWVELLQYGLDARKSQHALAIIQRSAQAQKQLIEDLLDVSRITSGKLRLELRTVRIEAIIEAAAEAARPAASAKKVALDISVSDVSQVLADPNRLQQVVWNLLSNAIKFTGSGGRVWIGTDERDGQVVIEVGDTGIGIAPEFLPYVFDRFRQADGSSTRPQGGLGLGLTIVRHLVELHGGTVWAESAGAEKGSTFFVALPAVERISSRLPQASIDVPPLFDTPSLEGIRVLVVDDDPATRELAKAVLERRHADARASGSAAEALEVLERWPADLLIADLEMPGVDGFGLIAEVRRREAPTGRRIAAAAVTGYARTEERDRALAAGFDAHLAKPVEPANLVLAVASLIGRGTPAAGTASPTADVDDGSCDLDERPPPGRERSQPFWRDGE
jgi:signal transduction histidine kinase/CheY-like chemotaxis protein